MKKILLSLFFVSAAGVAVHAQSKTGKVTYDRTVKLQINFAGMPGGMVGW